MKAYNVIPLCTNHHISSLSIATGFTCLLVWPTAINAFAFRCGWTTLVQTSKFQANLPLKSESRHPVKETHFGHLYLQSHSFGLHPQVITIHGQSFCML